MYRVCLITNIASPYQVSLFNEISKLNSIELQIIYTRESSPGRNWKYNSNEIQHNSLLLKEIRIKNHLYFNYEIIKVFHEINKADCLIVCQYSSITMQIAVLIASFLKKRIIFWSEPVGKVLYEERKLFRNERIGSFFRDKAIKNICKYSKEYWVIGINAWEALKRYADENKFSYFYYYSDLSNFLLASTITNQIKKSQKEKFVFAYSGILNYRKGFDILLDATNILQNERTDFKVIVMGDGALEKNLKTVLYPQIEYIGFVDYNKMSEIFAESDVFIFPSRYDGWALSIIEALASNLPVITTKNVGAALTIIEEDVNGWFIEPLDKFVLAKKMNQCIENKDRIRNMNVAQSAVMFDSKNGAKRFADLIQKR